MAHGPYSRVYHELMDEYPSVWKSQSQLGCYMQCLVLAEKFYPSQAPLPRRNPQLQALIRVGLVLVNEERGTFTVKGLTSERERRSDAARNAAAVRWASGGHSGRNADAMPRREETRIEEKSSARAPNGTGVPSMRIGYPPKAKDPEDIADLWNGKGLHDGSHPNCAVCESMRKPA